MAARAQHTRRSNRRGDITRNKILTHALRLMYERGYEGTSLQAILRAAKVNPGSFHFLFQTKENLLIAVLDRFAKEMDKKVLSHTFPATTPPLERIWRRFRLATHLFAAYDRKAFRGCFAVVIAMNLGSRARNGRIFHRVNRIFGQWEALIASEIASAVKAGQLPGRTPVGPMAKKLLAFYLGACLLGRIHSDVRVARELLTVKSSPPSRPS